MVNTDRRFTYRLELPRDAVRVLGDEYQPIVVADLSASGSGLIVPAEDLERLVAQPAKFELYNGLSFSTRLDPVRTSLVDGRLRVGARFRELPVDGLRTLSQFLIQGFIEERQRLDRLLADPRALTTGDERAIRRHLRHHLIAEGRSLRVYDCGRLLPTHLIPQRIQLHCDRHWIQARCEQEVLEEGKSYTFVVAEPGSVTYFDSSVERRLGDTVFVAVPEQIRQAGFRDSIRTPLGTSTQASVRLAHPRLPGGFVDRPLLDVSARGFAFESDPERDLLFPGDQLRRILIEFPGRSYEGAGVIRGIAPYRGSDRYSCGVEIVEFAEEEQERHWRERAFKQAHPRISSADPRRSAQRAWQVLKTSGYVELWTAHPSDDDDLSQRFLRFWERAPADVSRLLLLETDGETIGTVAGSLLFPKTWLVHHFGVDREKRASPAACLGFARELYAAYMYVLQHVTTLEYFVIYVEKDKRFTQGLYGDFVDRYTSAEDSEYQELRVFRCCPMEPRSQRVVRVSTVVVAPADPTELASVSRHLEKVLHPLEFGAFAYDERSIGLGAFGAECRARNYDRARHVYLAREAGTPVAALIAESGEEGANVFGLMNRCALFPLGSEPISPDVRDELLHAAKAHYLALGKHTFLFLGEPDTDTEAVESLGYEFVSEGVRWIARRNVVPAWLTFVRNSLAS